MFVCNSFIFNVGVLTVSQAKYLVQIYHRTIHAQRSNFTYFKISRSLCEKFDTDADIQDSIFLASEVFTTKTKSACLTSQLITYLGVVKLEENFLNFLRLKRFLPAFLSVSFVLASQRCSRTFYHSLN